MPGHGVIKYHTYIKGYWIVDHSVIIRAAGENLMLFSCVCFWGWLFSTSLIPAFNVVCFFVFWHIAYKMPWRDFSWDFFFLFVCCIRLSISFSRFGEFSTIVSVNKFFLGALSFALGSFLGSLCFCIWSFNPRIHECCGHAPCSSICCYWWCLTAVFLDFVLCPLYTLFLLDMSFSCE